MIRRYFAGFSPGEKMKNLKWGALVVLGGLLGVIVFAHPREPDSARATTPNAPDIATAPLSAESTAVQVDLEESYKRGWKEAHDAITRGSEDALQKAREAGYEDGQRKGYDEGYQVGQNDGRTEGIASGLQQGAAAGYTQGHQVGFAEGHVRGFAEGYDRGLQADRNGN
jgi:flagellar biosynthesis/type III secretory pathway protein FliH